MSEENVIIPSAPTLIYSQLAKVIPEDAYEKSVDNNFRLKNIFKLKFKITKKL